MAYIMWDDKGVMQFMEEFEPEFVPKFNTLTRNVERSDIFRILVPKYIGGIVSSLRGMLRSLLASNSLLDSTEISTRTHSGRR